MNRFQKSSRAILHWSRRWLRTSKPTEWISTLTAFIGVLATVIAAILYFSTGVLDAKRSELETRRSELGIQNTKLELDQIDLLARRDVVSRQNNGLKLEIEQHQNRISKMQEQLDQARGELKHFTENLSDSERKLLAIQEHEKSVTVLRGLGRDFENGQKKGIYLACNIGLGLSQTAPQVAVHVKRNDGFKLLEEPLVSPEKDVMLDAVLNVKGINSLSFKGVKLAAKDLQKLSENLSHRILFLIDCGIDDNAIKHLSLDKKTTYLHLDGNPITRLPNIKHAWALQTLYLRRTNVGDDAVVPLLKNAVNCFGMKFDNSQITDKSLEAIPDGNKDLDNLSLYKTKVTIEGVKRMIARIRPKWVVLEIRPGAKKELEEFLEKESLDTAVLLLDRPYGENTPGSKSEIIQRTSAKIGKLPPCNLGGLASEPLRVPNRDDFSRAREVSSAWISPVNLRCGFKEKLSFAIIYN